jgi:hypothetical protein
MSTNRRDPYRAFERFAVGVAALGIILFTAAYFGVSYAPSLPDDWRSFLQDIVTNLIPTLLVFVLTYVLLYRRIQKLQSEKEMEALAKNIADDVALQFRRTLTSLRDVVPSAESAWLYSAPDILELESKVKSKEIWIVSPHLLNDTGTMYESQPGSVSTVKTGQKNLRRGINYTFIVPDTEQIQKLLPQLRSNYEGYEGSLRVITLPVTAFDRLAFSEMAIYNPRMEGRYNPPRVFLELPVAVPHAYWVELADDVASVITARVQQIVDDKSATQGE